MNTFKLIPAAAVLSLGLTLFACKEQPKSTPAANTSTAKSGDGIVFVNSDSLLTNYSYSKDVTADMQEKGRKADADLTAKGATYQKEVNEYQRAAQTMSADQRAATEERLVRKQRELQSLGQNAQSALANENAAQNAKLYDKVQGYLKSYAKEKGYKMVLTYSKGNSAILFADPALDVTKEVVKGLNAGYKKGNP